MKENMVKMKEIKKSFIIYFIIILILILIQLCSCSKVEEIEYDDGFHSLNPGNKLAIVRKPEADDYKKHFEKISQLPDLESLDELNYNCSCFDLSELDLTDKYESISKIDFDDFTIWPSEKKLPENFDIEKIKELGKDPGINIRKVHEMGITGKNIGIAIIDQTLLVEHKEYKDNLVHYEEIHMPKDLTAQMHGSMVSSIAVGKNVGVAPDANLYYFATGHIEIVDEGFNQDLSWFADAIDRIIEINKLLDKDKKIRVVSFSQGINSGLKNYKLAFSAIKRANEENIEVIYISDYNNHPCKGIFRDPFLDPNDTNSFVRDKRNDTFGYDIYVPNGWRTVASQFDVDKYQYMHSCGASGVPPYVAGLYALCLEVNPELSLRTFYELLDKTSKKTISNNDKIYKVANPVELINYLQDNIS